MFLPLFSYSPEEIFSGDILLFDVDFFNPQKEVYARTEITTKTSTSNSSVDGTNWTDPDSSDTTDGRGILITDALDLQDQLQNSTSQETTNIGGINTVTTTTTEESVKYYYYLRDPSLGDTEENRIITSRQNTALDLQPLVSQWYSAIRNIAIVASMSVLLYVGIRMLLSSVSQEKAKYKQMLMDWVVGVCLLFFMHYIMAFSVEIVQTFNDLIKTSTSAIDLEDVISNGSDGSEGHISGMDQIVLLEDDDDKYISDKLKELGMSNLVDESTDPAQIMWPTNMMGMLRLKAQVSYGDMAFVGYGLCYVALVLFTVYFSFVYLRRVLYMAFLTMIAPLVALTYPIDKISDGQAQGFNKWLKEYIFNLLLQPLHLLLYTILVTSAYELSSTNPFYSLVAIAFMLPAEKLMRSFFGFEKATTPGSVAGAAAGAAMLNSGLQKLLHKPPRGKDGKGRGGNGSDDDSSAPPRIGYNADSGSSTNSENAIDEGSNDSENAEEQTPQQAMLDAYDDKYGTDEWDPAERDRMAREAYKNDGGRQYSNDEYRNILKDSGYSDAEIAELMGDTNANVDAYDDKYGTDEWDPAERDQMAREAFKNDEGRQYSDDEYRNILKDSGYSDKEIAELMGDTYNANENNNRQRGIDTERNINQIDEGDNDDGQETANVEENTAQGNQNNQQQATETRRATIDRPRGFVGRMQDRVRTNTEANKEFLQRTGRAASYTAKQGVRALGKTAPKVIRTGGKVLAGAAVAATAMTTSAAATLMSGDPSKIGTAVTGAAVAGYALASSRINTNNPSHTKSAAQMARERAFWGDDYDRHVAEENIKKWKKDVNKRENLERYLGREKTKKLYNDGKIDKYLQNEITSEKDIAALEKLQEKNDQMSFNDALLVFDAYDKYGDIDRQKDKDKIDITGGYAKQFQRSGANEQRAKEKAEKITGLTTDLDTIKKNLR